MGSKLLLGGEPGTSTRSSQLILPDGDPWATHLTASPAQLDKAPIHAAQ